LTLRDSHVHAKPSAVPSTRENPVMLEIVIGRISRQVRYAARNLPGGP
jgi:hypothetical protein